MSDDSDRDLHAMFMGFAIGTMQVQVNRVVNLTMDMTIALEQQRTDDYENTKKEATSMAEAMAHAASLIADAALHKLSHG